MVIERNQIFILLRSVLRGYRMGLLLGYCYSVLAMGAWQCGIWIVSMMGPGLGCWGAINGGRRGRWVGPGWGFV